MRMRDQRRELIDLHEHIFADRRANISALNT